MIDIRNISRESAIDEVRANGGFLWLMVAFIPVLFRLPETAVPVWSLGLVLGGWIANKHPLRWIALAWIIAIFFPQMPFLILACSGVLLQNWRNCIYAALLGFVISLMPIPGEFLNTGTILIGVGLILIIYRKVK